MYHELANPHCSLRAEFADEWGVDYGRGIGRKRSELLNAGAFEGLEMKWRLFRTAGRATLFVRHELQQGLIVFLFLARIIIESGCLTPGDGGFFISLAQTQCDVAGHGIE